MNNKPINHNRSKDASGRGAAIIVYWLLLGSVMTVVTAPLGVVLAYLWRGRSAAWVTTHLRYQIATFWWVVAGLLVGVLLWWWLGRAELPALGAWSLGYLVFTAQLVWIVGRCALGLHRLTANQPVGRPR